MKTYRIIYKIGETKKSMDVAAYDIIMAISSRPCALEDILKIEFVSNQYPPYITD